MKFLNWSPASQQDIRAVPECMEFDFERKISSFPLLTVRRKDFSQGVKDFPCNKILFEESAGYWKNFLISCFYFHFLFV